MDECSHQAGQNKNERIKGKTKVGEISKKVQESRLKWYLSAFDDAVMGHFVDHLSRAECVKTCTRHNDRLGLRHQQRGRQRRQDGVCVTVGALTT